ncbi:MAG: hypothetical protein ACRD2G_07650 [Terriglobia bacterium]
MEITLTKLQKLATQKAPIVGIPGREPKPFAMQRDVLARLIEGLEICEVNLTTHLEIKAERRHYRLASLDMRPWTAPYKTLRAWAARQRTKKSTLRLSHEERRKAELLRKIAVAERKAKHLRDHSLPYNPSLEFGRPVGDYERQEWARWHAEKPMRRKIGRLATIHGLIHGYVPQATIREPRKLYSDLAALTGQEITKYGDLHSRRGHDKPTEAEYLKHLYDYVGQAFESKPYRSEDWRTAEHVRQDRLRYCQQMRDWRNTQETVNWLRAQLVSFETTQESDDEMPSLQRTN